MKRFKLIFHIIYIIITLVVMYFSIDILFNTEAYLSKIKLSSYIKFPKYVMGIFLFISILMAVEYVLQQLRIRQIKQGAEELEREIVALKAKLYDKGQQEEITTISELGAEEENEDNEEDED